MPRPLLEAPNSYAFRLYPIRNRLGDRWSQFGPSVHRIAIRMLNANLAGKGTFQQFGDTYVISFNRLKGPHAQAEGSKLYKQFMELLFRGKGGDDIFKDRKPRANGAAHPDGRRKGLFGRIFSWLATRLKRSHPADSSDELEPVEPDDPDAAEQPGGNGGDNAQAEEKAPSRAAGQSGRRYAARRPMPASTRSAGSAPPAAPRPPEKKKRNAHKLLREARSIEDAMAADVLRRSMAWSEELRNRGFPPPDLSFLYRSMWNLNSGHLTTYTSVPICWKNSMEIYRGADVIPSPRRPENLYELDLLTLENTIEVLDGFIERKRNVLFMASVHASTLADSEMSREFFAAAEAIAQPARHNLIFEIVDIGDYAHQMAAIRMVKGLSTYARAVTASIGLDDRNFAFWKQCNFMGVGVDLSRDLRVEEEVVNKLGIFAAQAKRQKLISYLRELDKRSVTVAALSSGFDFLEGALIGSSDDPNNLVLSEFSLNNLYTEPELVWIQ